MTITSISVDNISQNQATFLYTTDQACRAQLQLGLVSGNYTIKSDCAWGQGDQSADFGGLKSQTTYYFIIKCGDTQSSEQNFTTL